MGKATRGNVGVARVTAIVDVLPRSGPRTVGGDTLCACPNPPGRSWTLLEVGLSATIVSMSIKSLREVRDRFSEVVDRVEREHERVTVTRNGHAAAVILSPDDLAELEETLDVLSDHEALADIREADAAYRDDDVVRGTDAVRGLRP